MVQILDATPREGEQTPGVYFDIHIKTAIANLLNRICIDYIEAGHPAVSDEIIDAAHRIATTIDLPHYQSVDPAIVGRKTEIYLDNMAGLSSVKTANSDPS